MDCNFRTSSEVSQNTKSFGKVSCTVTGEAVSVVVAWESERYVLALFL